MIAFQVDCPFLVWFWWRELAAGRSLKFAACRGCWGSHAKIWPNLISQKLKKRWQNEGVRSGFGCSGRGPPRRKVWEPLCYNQFQWIAIALTCYPCIKVLLRFRIINYSQKFPEKVLGMKFRNHPVILKQKQIALPRWEKKVVGFNMCKPWASNFQNISDHIRKYNSWQHFR